MEPHGFLPQALIYLAAGVIAVPLCKRLGLGSVLGYLVAGMAIGPWGLRLIADPQTVLQFSEFGVVLLLFLIGLELNAQRVWALRRTIFGLGGVQVAATVAAVAGIGVALGQPLAVSAIAGMGFAMSSTAIGLATLTEKNLLATPGGQASFAVLLFQDLAVIPLLLVVGLLGGEAETLKWADAAKALGMIALLVVAGRWLVRRALRYVAETRLREVFVGFSLLLVLGTAALMEWVGLSMALGAFLAGVMLADSEYRHELELDIEPFKGLLLGLFFIAVGMSVDVGLFLRAPHLVLGLALGVVLLKAVILFPIAQAFGYCDRADAGLFAVALSQAGEFAFVLFGAASTVLPAPVAAILNAAVAVSMLTTPFVVMGYERFLMRRLDQPVRAPDAIRETNPVIVAGFGRFGWKAYYGDATRLDLLESAGAASARLLLIAIDDPEAAMQIAKRVRQRFPLLALVVRAHSRTDAYEYAEMGVPAVREVFASALDASARILGILGFEERDAQRIVQRFKEYDERQIPQNAPYRHDIKTLVALSEQGRRDIAELLAEEARSAPQIDQNHE